MSVLDQLKKVSVVVADTADFELLSKYQPEDATTNPSLLLAGTELKQYASLVEHAVAVGRAVGGTTDDKVEAVLDELTVAFGAEILKLVPGRVSTEVDAKLSFDTQRSIAKAKQLISKYAARGIPKERVYIKLASTWEGIQAARALEADGIACNLTLLFSFAQAVACAQAGVSLISPFVGRILDWHKKASGKDFTGAEDPGVQSVTQIYNYYKRYGYPTIVMGASFRNTQEIIELAGCDKITISPALLEKLKESHEPLVRKLSPEGSAAATVPPKLPELTQADFLFQHNEDPMAVEKLAEGIRNFSKDTRKLERVIREKLAAA